MLVSLEFCLLFFLINLTQTGPSRKMKPEQLDWPVCESLGGIFLIDD